MFSRTSFNPISFFPTSWKGLESTSSQPQDVGGASYGHYLDDHPLPPRKTKVERIAEDDNDVATAMVLMLSTWSDL